MLSDAGLLKCMWGAAVSTAGYLQNRLRGQHAHLSSFDMEVYLTYHTGMYLAALPIYPKRIGKLNSRVERETMLRYTSGGKGYRVMDLETGKDSARRVVHFDEHSEQ